MIMLVFRDFMYRALHFVVVVVVDVVVVLLSFVVIVGGRSYLERRGFKCRGRRSWTPPRGDDFVPESWDVYCRARCLRIINLD